MPPDSHDWMIYGASGYTGRLIVEQALDEGPRPILAGRSAARIEALAKETGCPFRVFTLDRVEAAALNLEGVAAVLNCAGPFAETAEPMIEACLQSGTHYLDITGEYGVIEHAARQHQRAVDAGIVIMPAVGFDVVPSDCLAAQLAVALPTACELELAFAAFGGMSSVSPGTATTALAHLGQGGLARIDSKIQRVPVAWQTAKIPFPSGERDAVTIPWGDIASAYYTTGIPNIRVSMALPAEQIRGMRRWRWLLPLARLWPIQWLGRRWIKRTVRGPSPSDRAQGHAEFWGRVTDSQGRTAEATLTTPEGYTLTAATALAIVQRVAAEGVPPGFSTPAKAFGGAFIEQIAGVKFEWRTKPQ